MNSLPKLEKCMAFTVIFILLGTSCAFGDKLITKPGSNTSNAPEVMVRVRAIRASEPTGDVNLASLKIDIDSRLSDLSAKLRQLHFRQFKQLSNDQMEVPLKRKESINLTERTVLTVRPLYVDDDRIGMWIKWTDITGHQVLLDTRMHFDSEESMITGTDSKEDSGLILAIDARRSR